MSYEELAKKLDYDPETGILTWKKNLGHRYAGKQAGCIHDPISNRFKIKYKNKRYFNHILCWIIYYGKKPEGQIDHFDINPRNNKISNLRDVSQTENMLNRRKSKRNKTGYTGVIKNKYGRFVATYRSVYLGTYSTLEEAAKVRLEAESKCPYKTDHHGL